MLVKWIRCTVVDRRGFERGQRKWAGLLGEPGFRAQGGGWSRGRQDVAHIFSFWESRAFYDSFMARSHDRLAASQAGTFTNAQVRLFDHRFDVKTGFEPRFTDADLIRVALCRVHEERAEHFVLMQEKVWNPAMAGSPGMVRGLFGEAPGGGLPRPVDVALRRRTRQVPHGTRRATGAAGADRGGRRGPRG
ncbi:hypothetical protein SALBM217S_05987 [Streptomyces griseoloalbus]